MKILEQANGSVTKAEVTFSDDFVTGMVKEKLDNYKFGKSSVTVCVVPETTEQEANIPLPSVQSQTTKSKFALIKKRTYYHN